MSGDTIASTKGLSFEEKLKIEETTSRWVQFFVERATSGRELDIFESITPDGHMVVTGRTSVSGRYSREECLTKLVAAYDAYTERPIVKFSHILIDGDAAFLRAHAIAGRTKHGPYTQEYYGFWIRTEKAGFAEIIEYLDTAELEVVVLGRKIVNSQ